MPIKSPPFTALSHRKRRAEVMRIKGLIHRERHRCGGLSYDDCDIDAAIAFGSWDWIDILFLGRDPAVYWNAEIVTAHVAFNDAVENAAFDEAWPMLSKAEQAQEAHMETTPNVNANGKVISHTWLRKPEVAYPQFGGLNFGEYLDRRQEEIAQDASPTIFCGYRILPGFRSGIGLKMIVDAEVVKP